MPIVGLPSPPAFPPPAGTQWTLERNVLLYGGGGQGPVVIFPTPGADTVLTYTSNWGDPAQRDNNAYSLSTLYTLRADVYLDSAFYATLAVDFPTGAPPNTPAEATYVKIDGGQVTHHTNPSVGAGFAWPQDFVVTYTTTLAPPMGVTHIEVWLLAIYADVWVALPASSRLPQINPGNPSLDPEQAGLELTWSRRHSRVPRAPYALGAIGALTWPPMWDGAKRFLLDGLHLQVDALPNGGYTVQGDWYFIRIPGDTDVTVGPPPGPGSLPHVARFDTDMFDDPIAVLA